MDQKPVLNEVEFRQADHTYWHAGQRLPSVTGIIGFLNNYAGANEDDMERGRQIGEAVHLATELYDRDNLDPESIDDVVRPYLAAYVRFLRESGFKVDLIEHLVYSLKLGVSGRLDRTGVFPNRKNGLLDLKTGKKLMPGNGPQTAGYKKCLIDMGYEGASNLARFTLQLLPDIEPPYRLHEHTDPHDLNVFLCALTITKWSQNNGVKPKLGA